MDERSETLLPRPIEDARVHTAGQVARSGESPAARYEEAVGLAAQLRAEVGATPVAGHNPNMLARCTAASERLETLVPRFAIDAIHIRRLAATYYGEASGIRRNRSQGARARLIRSLDIIIREASLFKASGSRGPLV